MSEDLKELLNQFNGVNFPEHIQEEFLTDDGQVNREYLGYRLDCHFTNASLKSYLIKRFGKAKFTVLPVTNEVTREEFLAEYSVAKYAISRQWVGHFYAKYGKILTRKKMYEYILSTSKPKKLSSIGGGIDVKTN